MPVFEMQTPDGKTFQVDAPDQKTAAASLSAHTGHSDVSMGEGIARSFSEGVPIFGALADKLDAATNAALAPYVDPLLPDNYQKLPGKTFSERYDQALKIQNEKDKDFRTKHPVASTAAEIAGGVASTGAAAMTKTGATLLGLTGDTLPQLVTRGAASGAGINATDAALRGEDPLTAAGIGGVIGAVAPVAGRVANAVTEPVRGVLRGIHDPSGEAERRVATALDRDIKSGGQGLSPQEFVAARNSGQPVNLMDVGGETTRDLARSAANTSPEGRAALNRAIDDRYTTQADRLTDWLRSTFHYPDATAQQNALENVGRTVNRGAYKKAYQEGSKGLWSPELERLAGSDAVASAMQKAIKSSKDEAIVSGYGAMNPNITFTPDGRIQFTRGPKGVPTYPDLQFWDLTRRELSDAAMRAGPGTAEARRLQSFAKSLNTELDRMVPNYAKARAGAAQFFGARDALDAGGQAVTSKMSNGQIRAGLAKMSPQEKQLFQDGFVDRYVHMIRELPDRRTVLNRIAQSPAARERLTLAVGPHRAKELEAMLRVEGIMDLARSSVQGNSTTARQLTELGLAGGVDLYQGKGHLTADPTALMDAALVYGAARGSRAIDGRVAQMVAKLLASNDLGKLQKGIRLLAGNQKLFGAIRNADAGLASIAARGSAPAVSQQLGAQ